MPPRFYVCPLPEVGVFELEGPEAHHLLHVLRLRKGERVLLFDGARWEATAEIVETRKKSARLAIQSRCEAVAAEPTVVLGTAIPKGERLDWLVEKATELSVARLVPLITERSVVEPRLSKLDKLRLAVIAACKQCGRSRLMQIDAPLPWTEFVSREMGRGAAIVAHPGGGPLCGVPHSSPIVAAVGPEGGLTEDELQAAQLAGATLVGLGPAILRIETAAIALAAVLHLGGAQQRA